MKLFIYMIKMKRIIIPILIMCILFSGCISGEDDTGTYDGDLGDLLIDQAYLPDGYLPDDCIGGDTDYSEDLAEYGYIEDARVYYKITIENEDSVTETMFFQNVIRFDKEKAADYLEHITSFTEEWYTITANETAEDWSSTYEPYEHDTIGDVSVVAIATIIRDTEDDSAFANSQQYYVSFVKKDIAVNIQGNDSDERLGIEELIDLARDIADRI